MGVGVRLEGTSSLLRVDEPPTALHLRVELRALPWVTPETEDAEARAKATLAPTTPRTLPPSEASADLDVALLRLILLTAVPSSGRFAGPGWPGAFVAAACEGLAVSPLERARMAATSAELVSGMHDGLPALSALMAHDPEHDLEGLVQALLHLNPGCPEALRVLLLQASGGGQR